MPRTYTIEIRVEDVDHLDHLVTRGVVGIIEAIDHQGTANGTITCGWREPGADGPTLSWLLGDAVDGLMPAGGRGEG